MRQTPKRAPLNLFLTILALNAMGNGVVRLLGLEPTSEHGGVHSVKELEYLVHSTREAGLLRRSRSAWLRGCSTSASIG